MDDLNETGYNPPQESAWDGLWRLYRLYEFLDEWKAVPAGLVLACIFWAMPFTTIGAEDPWYFWVGSGLLALMVSVIISWLLFSKHREKKPRPEEMDKRENLRG